MAHGSHEHVGSALKGFGQLDALEQLRAAGYELLVGEDAKTADRDPEVFVAEGSRVLVQLLDLGWPLRSVLLSERRAANHPDLVARVRAAGARVDVATQDVMDRVAGYHVHRGLLALAKRPAPTSVGALVDDARLVLATEGINDMENLGSLFRNAAAFGADAVILDPTTSDPFYRRAVRVSVGHVLTVPSARAASWPDDLDLLRASGLTVVALHPGAADSIDDVNPSDGRWALLVGAEGDGLSTAALDRCDVAVRIPMAPGVDSINVATAAAVALHHFARA